MSALEIAPVCPRTEVTMSELFQSLSTFLSAAGDLLAAILMLVRPWLPLGLWAVFWLFAIDWMRLRRILVPQGGMVAVLLIAVFSAWISTLIAPVATKSLLLPVVERIALLSTWIVVMMGCGAVQLLGCTGVWVPQLAEPSFPAANRVRVLDFETDEPDAL
jgi:hypothetical protein